MSTIPATRVNYFERQHIRLAELQDEQAYHLQMRRRHNLSHHSWGIVTGLDLMVRDDGQVAVTPGLAIDGYGRELLSLDYTVITRADFDRRGTSRLDVWLQYQVDRSSDRSAPAECGPYDSNRTYRATELAQVTYTRGGALPDPAHPEGVPIEAFDPPQLDTPDDPARRWPVYLGRVVMILGASGPAEFQVETSDRVYVGLSGEIIDHPGNLARIELGHRPAGDDRREIGPDEIFYKGNALRDFGLFVPQSGADLKKPIEPTISVEPTGTQIIGTTSVHGNLVLDGTSMQFPAAIPEKADPATGGNPAIYRIIDSGNDELRLDLGSLADGARALVIGVTKDGQFQPSVEITFPSSAASPLVRILGELRIEGTIDCQDVRVRTITAEAAAQITAMLQAALTA